MSHAPRPYGLHLWGDDPLDVLDMHAIDGWARRVSLLKSAGRLEGLQLRRVLPSGRVVRAVDQGGVFRVHVWPKAGDSGFPEHQGDSIPMFFSGVLVNGRSLGGAGIELELTRQCRDRLRGYDKTAPLPAAKQWLKRFRIDVPDIVSELGRVNTNSDRVVCAGQYRAWRSHPHNSPPLSTACPSSVATSA